MLTLETFGEIIRGALNNVTESGGGSLKEATKDFIQKKIEDEALIIPYAEAIVAALKRRRFSLTHEKHPLSVIDFPSVHPPCILRKNQ